MVVANFVHPVPLEQRGFVEIIIRQNIHRRDQGIILSIFATFA